MSCDDWPKLGSVAHLVGRVFEIECAGLMVAAFCIIIG